MFRRFMWVGVLAIVLLGAPAAHAQQATLEGVVVDDTDAVRFPLIEAMLTPIGVMGGIRGLFFFNIGGAWFDDTGFRFARSSPEVVQPVLGVQATPAGSFEQILGPPVPVSGFRLQDGRASYGIGLQTFALGFPVQFNWAWRTLFNRQWEDVLFAASGGSATFRRPRFDVWIGFDF